MSDAERGNKVFKWNQHAANISGKIQASYEEGRLFDITLVAGAGASGVRIQAHRLVLSTSSDYFFALFNSDMKESRAEEIELYEIDGDTMKLIVDFMYKGCIELQNVNVADVLHAADYFGIAPLIVACWDFMGKHLNVGNCIGIALCAQARNMTELFKKACGFAADHIEEVYKEKEFLQLNFEQIKALLESDDFSVSSEKFIFRGVVAWVHYDRPNRASLLCSLMSVVRFWFLTPKFITEHIIPICDTSEGLLIFKWLKWHVSPNTRLADKIKPRKLRGKIRLLSGASTFKLKIQTFDRESNSWSYQELPASPKERTGFSAAVVSNNLLITGGCIAGYPVNLVESLDLETLTWSSFQSMEVARYNHAMLESKGYVYVFGQATPSASSNSSDVEKFDLPFSNNRGKWCRINSLPQNYTLECYKSAAIKELLYVIPAEGKLLVFDTVNIKWIQRAYPAAEIVEFGFAAVGEYLYVVGGLINNKIINTVRRYCPVMNTWTNVAPLKVPRSHAVCVALNNRLIACGGKIATGECEIVEEYNPDTDEWTSLPPLLVSDYLYFRNPL